MSLKEDFELGHFSNDRTVMILVALKDELYAFCIMRWMGVLWGLTWIVMITFIMAPKSLMYSKVGVLEGDWVMEALYLLMN